MTYSSDPRSFTSFLRKEMMVLHAWTDDAGVGYGIYQKRDKSLVLVTSDGTEVRPLTLEEARLLKAENPHDYRMGFI